MGRESCTSPDIYYVPTVDQAVFEALHRPWRKNIIPEITQIHVSYEVSSLI